MMTVFNNITGEQRGWLGEFVIDVMGGDIVTIANGWAMMIDLEAPKDSPFNLAVAHILGDKKEKVALAIEVAARVGAPIVDPSFYNRAINYLR
jgi:hypothetical protein